MPPPALYAGHLAGDPRGWTQAIEFAGGISRGFDEKVTRFGGELAINLARPRPIGFHGAFTARVGNTRYAIDLRPLGVAFRFGGAVVGLSGGGALLTDAHSASPPAAGTSNPPGRCTSASAPITSTRSSPVHAMSVCSSARSGSVVIARIGRARAGVGPMLTGGYECQGDACGFLALVGCSSTARTNEARAARCPRRGRMRRSIRSRIDHQHARDAVGELVRNFHRLGHRRKHGFLAVVDLAARERDVHREQERLAALAREGRLVDAS